MSVLRSHDVQPQEILSEPDLRLIEGLGALGTEMEVVEPFIDGIEDVEDCDPDELVTIMPGTGINSPKQPSYFAGEIMKRARKGWLRNDYQMRDGTEQNIASEHIALRNKFLFPKGEYNQASISNPSPRGMDYYRKRSLADTNTEA